MLGESTLKKTFKNNTWTKKKSVKKHGKILMMVKDAIMGTLKFPPFVFCNTKVL